MIKDDIIDESFRQNILRLTMLALCTTLGYVNAAEIMKVLPVGVKAGMNFHYIFFIRQEIPKDIDTLVQLQVILRKCMTFGHL